MKKIVLSDRMSAVAEMVTKGNVVCDVGCDHGFVSIYLVQSRISPKVIAMDVNQGPLEAAKEHIGDYNLKDYIETRLSDGLENLMSGEADTLICAGMGGRLMQRILENGKSVVSGMKELVLQPQSEIEEFRKYLRIAGCRITDENMVLEDGKYYSIIKVCPGGELKKKDRIPPDRQRIEDKYGPCLLAKGNTVLCGYLQREKQVYGDILLDLQEHSERYKEIRAKIKDMEDALSICYTGK